MEKIAELKAMFAEGTPSRAEIEAAVRKFGRGFLSNVCGKGYEMDDEEENKRSRLIFGEEEDLPPLPPRVDAGFYVPVAVPPSAPSAASSSSSDVEHERRSRMLIFVLPTRSAVVGGERDGVRRATHARRTKEVLKRQMYTYFGRPLRVAEP